VHEQVLAFASALTKSKQRVEGDRRRGKLETGEPYRFPVMAIDAPAAPA
jgi:hypothetical protein